MVAFVSVARADVHHRRQTTAILGPEAAGIDVGVEDDVGLEDGVEAYAVEWVVDNHTVEQREVLYHRAAAYVELAALVARRVDARQHLQVLCQVSLAADGGHLLYLRGGDLLDRHLRLHTSFLPLVGGDDDVLEFHRGRFEVNVARDGLMLEGYRLAVFLIAYIFDLNHIVAVGHLVDKEIAVDVGRRPVFGTVEEYLCEGDSLALLVVHQHTLDGVLCLKHLNSEKRQ